MRHLDARSGKERGPIHRSLGRLTDQGVVRIIGEHDLMSSAVVELAQEH
jgi:hypothetical protein